MARLSMIVTAFGALAMPALGQLLGPSPYTSSADSPFNGLGDFALDNLEDNLLNIPGVTATGSGVSVVGPSSLTDSVDADDGAIDGFGLTGHSLFAAGSPGITLTFDAALIGGAPTHVGLVWTDGTGDITFSAFDTGGNLIDTVVGSHADGDFFGGTGEDRFYGIIHSAGIGSVLISNTSGGIEIDHIQYGVVVPTPGTLGLLVVGGALSVRRRRR